jgi:hypothetical protein
MTDPEGYRFEPAQFFKWLPVYLLVSFAVYVLSVGPMYWTIYEAYFLNADPYLARLYLPLVWLSGQSDLFAKWMEWYLGLWVL